jgi:hypothetical protein
LPALVVLAIGGGLAENYRGHYLWKKFRQEWEAKGERFDLAAFVPKPVPPDQNFATTPFFAPYLDYTIDETDQEHPYRWKDELNFERHKALATIPEDPSSKKLRLPDTGHWQLGTFTDLRPWQEYFDGNTNFPFAAAPKDPAGDVLTALHRYDAVLDELRAASARPYSVFPVHYDEHPQTLLPHLASLRTLAEVVRLRGLAHLEAGHPGEALQDAQFGLRLADTLKSEGFLISSLVRISIAELTLQPIWEGLAGQRWNDAQITELQSALARMNMLEDYGPTMRTERATALCFIDQLGAGKYRNRAVSGDGNDEGAKDYAKIRYLPGGVFRQNQLAIARWYQERLIPLVDVREHRVDVSGVNRAGAVREASRYHPYELFANLLIPAVSHSAERFARAQTGLDLALIACALERHRLQSGHYPDALNALTPRWVAKIPPDVITGQPLKYRVTEAGRFLLYSVGWNGSDEGGVPGVTGQKQRFDPKKGDWVWRYPVP